MVTRINVKFIQQKTITNILCCCNTKKKEIIMPYKQKRLNFDACNFRIKFERIDDLFIFISLKPHNHGPSSTEYVSLLILIEIYTKL